MDSAPPGLVVARCGESAPLHMGFEPSSRNYVGEDAQLIYMDQALCFQTISSTGQTSADTPDRPRHSCADRVAFEEDAGAMEQIFGVQKSVATSTHANTSSENAVMSNPAAAGIFAPESHIIPSMSALCSSFLQSLLLPAPSEVRGNRTPEGGSTHDAVLEKSDCRPMPGLPAAKAGAERGIDGVARGAQSEDFSARIRANQQVGNESVHATHRMCRCSILVLRFCLIISRVSFVARVVAYYMTYAISATETHGESRKPDYGRGLRILAIDTGSLSDAFTLVLLRGPYLSCEHSGGKPPRGTH